MIDWLLRLFRKPQEPDSDFPDFDFSDRIDLNFPPPTTRPGLEEEQ